MSSSYDDNSGSDPNSGTHKLSSIDKKFLIVLTSINLFWLALSGFFMMKAVIKIKWRKMLYKTIKDPKERMKLQRSRSILLENRIKDEELIWFSGITSISAIRKYLFFWVLGMLLPALFISLFYSFDSVVFFVFIILSTLVNFYIASRALYATATRTRIVYGLTPTRILLAGFRFSNDIRCYFIRENKNTRSKTHWGNSESLIFTTDRWTTSSTTDSGKTITSKYSMDIGINWIFEMDQVHNLIEERQRQLQYEGNNIENQQQGQRQSNVDLRIKSNRSNFSIRNKSKKFQFTNTNEINQMLLPKRNQNQINMDRNMTINSLWNQLNMNRNTNTNTNQLDQNQTNQINNDMDNHSSMQGPTDLTIDYDLNNNNNNNNNNNQIGAETIGMGSNVDSNSVETMNFDL
ncbi:hypothetical protein M0813_04762 [Anaeramoeba flamelloides]|uniref:Uncharacterized protein n=1 Tax=Anaeramoeba flamelloides TaxID=1746091 RepID=A0ABQ8XJ88_9EUKA|nr:hypothetical protein M0813_04762 [Anaeramoeba flamelloides]